jgi:hypothetical protein
MSSSVREQWPGTSDELVTLLYHYRIFKRSYFAGDAIRANNSR